MKEKIIKIIQESVGGCARHWAELIAENLIDKGIITYDWISVKEKLPDPKEHGWVLGAVKTTELSKGKNWYLPPHIVEYKNGEWWASGCEFSVKDLFAEVTHWMPLPKDPTE